MSQLHLHKKPTHMSHVGRFSQNGVGTWLSRGSYGVYVAVPVSLWQPSSQLRTQDFFRGGIWGFNIACMSWSMPRQAWKGDDSDPFFSFRKNPDFQSVYQPKTPTKNVFQIQKGGLPPPPPPPYAPASSKAPRRPYNGHIDTIHVIAS